MSAVDGVIPDADAGPVVDPHVEEELFSACSRTEVQVSLTAVYKALNELRVCLMHYCKGRGISYKPKDIPVRDMMILARTIVRATD